jgi:hypothetical protein
VHARCAPQPPARCNGSRCGESTSSYLVCAEEANTVVKDIVLPMPLNTDPTVAALSRRSRIGRSTLCQPLSVTQLCVKYNADINAQDEDNGGSPLMYAIHNSHDHIVEALLQLGAGMDQYEQQGYTPLMVACLSDNATACERLLQNDTVLDQTDSKGRTALSMACRCVAPG